MNTLPLFVRTAGRPVILLGDGPAAEAKRRLLERLGCTITDETGDAQLAIVAIEDDDAARAAVARLRARSILVNAVDRIDLCDFFLPAIVDRAPVTVAIGTGGAAAGLAAALRQRFEAWLPHDLGALAEALQQARPRLRARFPDGGDRRRAIAAALAPGGALDPVGPAPDVAAWLEQPEEPPARLVTMRLASADPELLTLRDARLLGLADRLYHADTAPPAILDRARADAERLPFPVPAALPPGLSIALELA